MANDKLEKTIDSRLAYADRKVTESVENNYPVAEVRYWVGQRDALRGIKEVMDNE